MSRNVKFVPNRPKEGTPTLGVVYHVLRESEIDYELGHIFEPIGWVVDFDEEPHRDMTKLTPAGGLKRSQEKV